MNKLEKGGFVDATTRHDILFNRLVAVVGVNSPLQLASLADLAKPEVKRLALADPRSVPPAFTRRSIWRREGLGQVEARVVPTQNVRAALAGVESGNADAGIVYQTDALISKKVKVAFALPDSPKVKIAYPGRRALARSQSGGREENSSPTCKTTPTPARSSPNMDSSSDLQLRPMTRTRSS